MDHRRKTRREALGVLGSAGATLLVGCGGRTESLPEVNSVDGGSGGAPPELCIVRPQQTEGPYFVDELLNRADIRSDPASGAVKDGVPLRLVLRVSRLDGGSCSPLQGATVDLWQCDALGVYSDVIDGASRFDTRGQKFLRGYQLTDAAGQVEFVTIYPGWYAGRTVHLHFKVRTESGHQFVSQLYFDQAVTDGVLREPPYGLQGPSTVPNGSDGIFLAGGDQLMLALTPDSGGYVGRFELGLQIPA